MQSELFKINPNEITGKRITKKSKGFVADPCSLCGLYKKCNTPKMKPYGDCETGIMFINNCPSEVDDKEGIPFFDKSGEMLDGLLLESKLDVDEEIVVTSIQQCYSEKGLIDHAVECCYTRLEAQIVEYKPKLIICLGQMAARRLIETKAVPGLHTDSYGTCRGDVYPIRKYNAWVGITFDLDYVLRNEQVQGFLEDDIEKFIDYLDVPFPKPLLEDDNNHLVEFGGDSNVLQAISNHASVVSFDFETNQIDPYVEEPKLLSMSFADKPEHSYIILNDSKKASKAISKFLQSDVPKLAHNADFEESWTRVIFGHGVKNLCWDTIISTHILDERKRKKGLALQAFKQTGEEYKDLVDIKDMENELKNNTSNYMKYSGLDARFPLLIMKDHLKQIGSSEFQKPMEFLMAGTKVFMDMKYDGIKIDVGCFEGLKVDKADELEQLYNEIMDSVDVKQYAKQVGKEPNLNSSDDLAILIFKIMGLKPISKTATGKSQVNKDLYDYHDGNALINLIKQYKKGLKTLSTYLGSYDKYLDSDGYIHPTYNLWTTEPYRSSCTNPNLQNIPNRDAEMRSIRKMFIPRNDYFLEMDFKGADIIAIAMESGDGNLTRQINSDKDIHRMWASKVFLQPESKVTKEVRFKTKGGFVFAEFYGSYYKQIADNLDISVGRARKAEQEFWDMYSGVAKWKRMMEKEYHETGVVTNALGFERRGPLTKNQIIPTIIQGDMFLGFLLDAMIRVSDEFKQKRMQSKMVIQVHDSVTLDVVHEERDDVIEIVNRCATKKDWEWCKGVKLTAEWSAGENWLDMHDMEV